MEHWCPYWCQRENAPEEKRLNPDFTDLSDWLIIMIDWHWQLMLHWFIGLIRCIYPSLLRIWRIKLEMHSLFPFRLWSVMQDAFILLPWGYNAPKHEHVLCDVASSTTTPRGLMMQWRKLKWKWIVYIIPEVNFAHGALRAPLK